MEKTCPVKGAECETCHPEKNSQSPSDSAALAGSLAIPVTPKQMKKVIQMQDRGAIVSCVVNIHVPGMGKCVIGPSGRVSWSK